MSKGFAVLILLWVFVLAPGFCLGAIGMHHCGCSEAGCGHDGCPSESSHNCHDDPCPKNVYRTEQDGLVPADSFGLPVAWDFSENVGLIPVLPDGASQLEPDLQRDPNPPPLLPAEAAFSLCGLPLLI